MRLSSRRIALAALLTVCFSRVGATQESEAPTSEPRSGDGGSESAPAPAQTSESALAPEQRLVIHGYFSQAYANSQGHQLIGIPDDGTFDYRRMAVLFRGNITRRDALVIQLAQRRLGGSPTMSLEPDVKVDWTFYEHRFNSGTSVRAGRIPNPLGIFSEIRYVGTLLPFYRAPYNFYQEGSFTSENVDGARVTQTIAPTKPWNAETTIFGGGFSMIESYAGQVNEAHTSNALGGQFWLNTPVDGLRFGVGGDFFDTKNTILTSSGKDEWKTWIASFDLSRTRVRLRSEYSEIHIKEAEFVAKAFYVYGGVSLTDKLVAHAQYDDAKAIIGTGDASATLPKFYRDTTLGLSYAFRPSVVAKAEHHWAKGRLIEDEAVPLDPSIGPFEGNYYILSLSASF
jgi:hypothetical protein